MMDRTTYEVRATRSGDWWAIDVPGLLGAHTQARRLDHVEHMAREVISLLLDIPEDSFDVRVQAELDDEWARLLRETREARSAADEASERAQRLVRTAIVTLQGAGLSTREVGQLLGVTHQRVQQLAAHTSKGATNAAKR
jgi:DNA-directed RNA polymerase specialized sigma24 family protein